MIDKDLAHQLANDWISAWNSGDLDAIMEHHAENVEFRSPLVIRRMGIASGRIDGKEHLRAYFAKGLETITNLHFELLQVLLGVDGMTVYYRRESGAQVAEVIVLDEQGKAVNVRVHYSQ
jgi:ketosteroid isomerase-like protein